MIPTGIAVIATAGWAGSRLVEAFHAQPLQRHSVEVDLSVEQAAAPRFAQGERPTVGYCQTLRATELANQIVSMRRERP